MRCAFVLLLAAAGFVAPACTALPARSSASDAQLEQCLALRRSQPREAIAQARRALGTGNADPVRTIRLLGCLGQAQAIDGQSAEAVASIDQAMGLLKRHPQPTDFVLRAYANAASALHIAGRLQRAMDYYRLAYVEAEAANVVPVQVTTLINLGLVYSEELEDYSLAEAQYARAQALASRAGLRLPLLPYNRAMNQIRAGHDAQALPLLRTAERLAGRDDGLLLARCESERVALQARESPSPRANTTLLSIAARQMGQQDRAGAATTLLHVAALAMTAHHPDEALQQASAALQLAQGGGYRVEQRDALRAQLAAERAQGDDHHALETAMRLSALQFNDLRTQNLDSVADLQDRLDAAGRARELAAMRADQRVQALQLDSARNLRNLVIAGCCAMALLSAGFFVYQRRVQRRLEELGSTDPMTGMLNRRVANQRMAQLPTTGGRGERNVAFLVDIDHFKDINDLYGHDAGDVLLMEVARRLRTEGQPGDIVARWGGEEFLVARAGVDMDSAARIAEDMRVCINDRPIGLPGGGAHSITASIGFASWPFHPGSETPGDFHCALSLADRALYAAKHGGRDAWTGLWGADGVARSTMQVIDAPAEAEAAGLVHVLASRGPVRWQTRAAPAETVQAASRSAAR